MESSGLLGHKIFLQLEDNILNGKYSVGENLGEHRISEEFGVSRTPVREAIKSLEASGLVQIVPNKGAVVLGISDKDMLDMYEIRKRIEPLAAKWTAEKITDQTIKELAECIDLWEFYFSKNGLDKLNSIDSKFHTIIYHACGSRLLLEELIRLLAYTKNMKDKTFLSLDNAMVAHNEHKEILEAIKNKDGINAEKLAKKHIENALNRLFG